MNFNLTDERQMLQDMLRRYLSDNYDHETRSHIVADEKSFSSKIWQELAELGMVGVLFSEREGGFGGSGFDLSVVFEELGRVGVVEPLLATAVLAGGLVAEIGNDAQKNILKEVIAGKMQLAFAHGESQSRYELSRVETTAQESQDRFVLNGRKALVMNGGSADKIIVSARLSGAVDAEDGIALFIIDADVAGVERRAYPTMIGTEAAEITLSDCIVSNECLLGVKGNAFAAIEYQSARATAAVCAETLGAMEIAKDLTLEYLKTRHQFGQPIGKLQALQHRMANMLIELEQARSAVVNACGHLEAERGVRERYVSAAKNLIGRVGRLIAEESIQLHGGIGMTEEYALGHFAKRMVMVDHQFGDTDYHLQRFIELSS